jgi:cryptochrome 2
MWEVEAAARASNSSGTVEVVLDNTDDTKNLAIPKVVLK